MKNGAWQTADEFMEEQAEIKAKRTVRGIALSIEHEMQEGHKHLRKISGYMSLLSKSIAGAIFFLALIIIIKELRGTNFLVEVANWLKISSTVAESHERK